MALIMTKAALALKNAENNFRFVKYEAHKPKKKASDFMETTDTNIETNQFSKKDLDLKKIRHEIVKFGMSGFNPTKKEEAKIALAVSLGAKPPKKEYINYKELMKKNKTEKLRQKKEKLVLVSKTITHKISKKKNKSTNNDVGHLLTSYGKVQKKDLKTDEKSSKRKKKKK